VARVPKIITINEDEVREALYDSVGTIVETIRVCLERIPARDRGRHGRQRHRADGGGALLAGLDDIIRKETYLPSTIAPDPLSAWSAASAPCSTISRCSSRVALEQ